MIEHTPVKEILEYHPAGAHT